MQLTSIIRCVQSDKVEMDVMAVKYEVLMRSISVKL